MKPAPFDWVAAHGVEEILEVLSQEGSRARVLAGGQSLIPMLNMRLAKPQVLVDINRVPSLGHVELDRDALVVGAAVTQASLEAWPQLESTAPLLKVALPWVGHYQTRSRGTVVGSMVHADPSAELPLCLCAMDGRLVLRRRGARRILSGDEFFLGMMSTALKEDEFVESVRFPRSSSPAAVAFREFGRRHGDFAIVAVAVVIGADEMMIAVGGVNDTPYRKSLPRMNGENLDDALNHMAWELDARDDAHASARLRRELVRRLGRDAVRDALART